MRNRNLIRRLVILMLGFSLMTIMFNACKKDQSSTGGYLMKFDVDGTTVEFTEQASLVAAFAQTAGQYNVLITGYNANSNMDLQIFDGKAITQSSYSGYTISGSALVGVLISYQDATGSVYTQAVTNSDAVISISEMTGKTIRGTFSSTIMSAGKSDIKITNGEFFVWRAN